VAALHRRSLSDRQWAQLKTMFATADPTGQPRRPGRQGVPTPAPRPGRGRHPVPYEIRAKLDPFYSAPPTRACPTRPTSPKLSKLERTRLSGHRD